MVNSGRCATARNSTWCILVIMLFATSSASGLEFDMMFQTKCIMEEITSNVLVVGEYSGHSKISPGVLVPMVVKVEDPTGKTVYEKATVTSGQFAFTSHENGDYKACFTAADATTAQNTLIRLEWKTGAAATDWDVVAKKDHLSLMQTEALRLEALIKQIHEEMMTLRTLEEKMRDLNESTNARVARFSIGSLVICVGLAVWQMLYLRRFFRKKKVL